MNLNWIKAHFLCWLLLLLGASGCSLVVGDYCSSVVVNGDFEKGIDYWFLGVGANAAATWGVDESGGRNGSNAAHLEITGGNPSDGEGKGWVAFFQPPYSSTPPYFTISNGSTYTLSFWAKVDVHRTIKVIAKDENVELTKEPAVELKTNAEANAEGQVYSVELHGIKDSTNGRLLFECVIHTNEVVGNIWFDDIQFYESSACK